MIWKLSNAIFDLLYNSSSNLRLLNQITGSDLSVAEKITEQSGVIGEKIEISYFERISAEKVVAYNHPGNQIASMVGLTADAEDEGKQ